MKKQQLINQLKRTKLHMAAGAMCLMEYYGDDYIHAKELAGAADMIQDWIDSIKEEAD